MMRKFSWMLLSLLTMSLWAEEENQEPVVTNPIAKQLDYEHVLISYDVEDADGDLMSVSVKVSDDGGKTFGFTAPLEQLSGDVGEGVSSGKGKEIVWRIGVDEFLHVYGENYVIRVLADDGVKPVLGEKIVWEKDGSEMMRIPAGSFEMGDHLDGMSNAPVHRVELDEFYMDSREVTNGQYGVFMEQTGHRKPIYWTSSTYNQTNQPVVGVDWHDAVAYAKWAGKRLPTEAEWEYAARGGLAGKRYPWGDEGATAEKANYGQNVGKPAVVGSYPANGYGLYDMAGNVWEWCQDWYYQNSAAKNPPGPDTGSSRVLRGGLWDGNANTLRVARRRYNGPTVRNFNGGFRCVSGSDFTSGASAGGDFTSDEGAPLPLAGNQGVIEWEKDNSQMALIPAGSFEMGDHFGEGSEDGRELPVHTVELDAFYMDVYEVTVGQFREFVNQSGYSYDGNWDSVAKHSPGDEYPMVEVNWNDATAYAKWAGKRLPTEAEWEYAARGGLVGKRYPGGDEITHDDANWGNTVNGKDKWSKCAPVGSFAANGYGLYGMAGNVWEWCQDWYEEGENYYSSSPAKNPPGPDTGSYRVLRGGSWSNGTSDLRVAYRGYDHPNGRDGSYGFRCVSDLP